MNVQTIIKKAYDEVGVFESPPNSNNVKYNTWYYGHEVSGSDYPWCAAFISWLFKDTGLVKKTASCVNMAQWFKDIERWSKTPEPGDLVFYKFGTNSRWTNHVGLVVSVSGSQITAIEGNTSTTSKGSQDNGGMVALRKRSANIIGYGRPNYIDAKPITDHPTLKMGSTGAYVKILQGKLNQNGANLEVDGEFGKATYEAVKAYQWTHNLTPDGIVGAMTWNKLI